MTQFTCKGVKQINNRISLNMTFTFTIRISLHFSSAREFEMGEIFQKYWSQNAGQDFIVLYFYVGGGRAGGKGVYGRLMEIWCGPHQISMMNTTHISYGGRNMRPFSNYYWLYFTTYAYWLHFKLFEPEIKTALPLIEISF